MNKVNTMYKVKTMYKMYTIYRVYSLYFFQLFFSTRLLKKISVLNACLRHHCTTPLKLLF